jgi:hypothetical protein
VLLKCRFLSVKVVEAAPSNSNVLAQNRSFLPISNHDRPQAAVDSTLHVCVFCIKSSLLNRRFTLKGKTQHDTTRHDKVLFYGFHMFEFPSVRHRQLTTKTVSLGLREENILPLLTDGRWFLSCRVMPCRIM